ncbi:MAG: alpha/beta hydrolase [Bacteroidetes bacterium]|nr:alpha/beta hydrolase [Bacteroidota bacterium]
MTDSWIDFQLDLTFATVSVKTKGEGRDSLICLHGYMQSKNLFDVLFPEVPKGWRVVCIDLPLFGNSEWKGETGIDKSFFDELWQALVKKYPDNTWHIMGFSMGGKMAMLMAESSLIELKTGILIAPDGIKSNYWHLLITRTGIGKFLFKFALRFPKTLMAFASFFRKIMFIGNFSLRFLRASFVRPRDRELLENTIRIYHVKPFRFKEWCDGQLGKNTRWLLIWGKKDRVLRPSVAKKFTRAIPNSEIHLVNAGHMLIGHNPRRLRKILDRNVFHTSVKAGG